jgi:hypothetical protein
MTIQVERSRGLVEDKRCKNTERATEVAVTKNNPLRSRKVERMTARLRDLARSAWEQHQQAERATLPHLVRPSIPILLFGDSQRFAAAARRVITVGLNPSREEFPSAAPFRRFPGGEALNGDNAEHYLASLNRYFRTAPYTMVLVIRAASTRPRRELLR